MESPSLDPVIERMRRDWNARALKDHRFYIATGAAASESSFRLSGLLDIEENIRSEIDLSRECDALEIGCGVGRLLLPLSERVRSASGVDISEEMIRKSKTYCAARTNVQTSVTDGGLGAFADSSQDLVYSFIVFQHIPELPPIRRYVEEAARVLRPGGLFRFQVDGRYHLRGASWRPGTYDGVKLSPSDIRPLLLDGTSFELLDEWGAGTHYYWLTARRQGSPSPVATLRRRAFDLAALADVLRGIGHSSPKEAAHRVRTREETLFDALSPLRRRLAGLQGAVLVRETYFALLGWYPSDEETSFQVDAMATDHGDLSTVFDSVVTSRGFRDIVCPYDIEIPWYRRESVLHALPADRRPDPSASFFDLSDALEGHLSSPQVADPIESGFVAILGQVPDPTAREFYGRVVDSSTDGLRRFLRELLNAPEAPTPPTLAPVPDNVRRIRADLGLSAESLTTQRIGESFPGEASIGRELLLRTRSLGDPEFIGASYQSLFGRSVDGEGEAFYLGKLTRGEVDRPGFVRSLLWSDELRRV